MEAFYDLAFKHLEEEIEDACEYLHEAEEAEADGKDYLAHGLRKVAHDEYTHANFLRDYLMSKKHYHEHANYEKIEAHWHKLRSKLGLEK